MCVCLVVGSSPFFSCLAKLSESSCLCKVISGGRDIELSHECIASLLVNRAFYDLEFEDVRKLSAELCGRIHPQVLLPILCSQLQPAVDSKNILKIKACLFSICTSLVVRGWESFSHPAMLEIRRMIETVLLWPCLDDDSGHKLSDSKFCSYYFQLKLILIRIISSSSF